MQFKVFFVWLLFFQPYELSAFDCDSLYNQSLLLQYSHPDSARKNFTGCLPYFEEKGDTAKIINVKLKLIQLHSGSGNYQKAYEHAWSLLSIMKNNGFAEQKVQLHKAIASLYIIFGQFDEARMYLEEAILLSYDLNVKQQRIHWLSRLYGLKAWLITKEKSDFPAAKQLLLMAIEESLKLERELESVYLKMQLAELYILNDRIMIAEEILKTIELQTKDRYKLTHSLLFDHMGQLYMKKQDYDSAAFYLLKCVKAIDQYQNHLDNKVEVLDSLSSCYHYLGRDDLAFEYVRKSQLVNNRLFGSRSSVNKELFEIKNQYEEQLKRQQVRLLEQDKAVLRLKTIIYVSILSIIIIALIIRSKIRTRKIHFLKEKRLLERKQQEREIENKNKELISSALQLIEQDSLLEEIRKRLISIEFQDVNQKVINSLLSTINANKTKKWDEFELYFTHVNEDYYGILKRNSPSLSATDLKMCALIKLGLSSKEMADIMGISADSVNTSRSRIRKKMNLSREVNLTEYLRGI